MGAWIKIEEFSTTEKFIFFYYMVSALGVLHRLGEMQSNKYRYPIFSYRDGFRLIDFLKPIVYFISANTIILVLAVFMRAPDAFLSGARVGFLYAFLFCFLGAYSAVLLRR